MIFNFPSEQEQINKYLEGYEGVVEVTKKHKQRSLNQNAYLHACIGLFAIETGYTLDEMKHLLKVNCVFMRYVKNEQMFLRSSAHLDTKEMTIWIDWIRNYAGKQGIDLPSADIYNRDWVKIEKTIERHKAWL